MCDDATDLSAQEFVRPLWGSLGLHKQFAKGEETRLFDKVWEGLEESGRCRVGRALLSSTEGKVGFGWTNGEDTSGTVGTENIGSLDGGKYFLGEEGTSRSLFRHVPSVPIGRPGRVVSRHQGVNGRGRDGRGEW